jgi:hypothetical protein
MPDVAVPSPTDRLLPRHPVLMAMARTLLTSAAVLGLYLVAPFDPEFTTGTVLALVAGIVAVGVLLAWQVRAIVHAPHPGLRAIEAIALSLPLFLLLFAATYTALSAAEPEAFTEPLSRTDSLYFVVTVFATVGFGDVSAVSELARMLVTLQMVGDLVLIGLVARVFMLAVDRGRRRATGQEDAAPLARS